MNVMRFLAGLGFGAAAGWLCALIVFDSEWATAPVIISSIGAILLSVLSTFARNGEDAPLTDGQLDFALRRGVTGTAEVREIERTDLSIGDLPVYRQMLYVEPGQGSPYRTIMSVAIDPVPGSRPVGARIPIVQITPGRPGVAFNRHGSLADTDRTGGLDSTVDPGWAGADRSERYSSAPDAYSSTGAYSSAGAYSSRRNLDAVPFWTTGYDDERLTQTRRPILPRLAEFRARPRRSPLLPVVAFVLGLVLSLAPFYQRLSAGIEDVQAGRFGGADLLTDGEALEAALSRFSQRTGVTGVCRLLVSDEYVSLQAPKPDGAPGQDDYIVKLNSDRIWSESADCDHELIALAEVDAAVISAAYGRAVDEAGFTAEDINPDKGTAQVARNVVGPEQILIRVNVYASGARSHTRVETPTGEHVSSTGVDGETVEGPAGG